MSLETAIMIRPCELEKNRSKKAFTDMIRIARMSNAIAFASKAAVDAAEINDETALRQKYHATFLLCGYMYEALKLVDSLKKRYQNDDAFEDLLDMADRTQHIRTVLAELNFSPSFHHSWDDRQTPLAARAFQLPDGAQGALTYEAFPTVLTAYYPLVTFVDTCYIGRSLENNFPKPRLQQIIYKEVPEIADRFIFGADLFITGLAEKMGLGN